MTAFNSSTDSPGFDSRRLRDLIAALCDDNLSPADKAELEGTLLAADGARTQFLGDICVHAGLEWEFDARGKLESLIESCRQHNTDGLPQERLKAVAMSAERSRNKITLVFLWAAAVTLLLGASTLLLPAVRHELFGAGRLDNVALSDRSTSPPNDEKLVIATISPASEDCRWMFETKSISEKAGNGERSKVHSGETLRVTKGTLQLTFNHGTAAMLTAPALLEIVSPMRGRLIRGRVTVNVAKGAEGFTIDTPRTSVVDLGTVFGVEVDDFGRTDVVVFSGIVDVTYTSDVLDSASVEVDKKRLYMGEAMRVDDRGTLSRIISLRSNHFSADSAGLAASARPPVISLVRDNIKRENAWNFYEIVQGGMREDAKAFVDRLHHEWNGVDAKGIPEYLVGGDYVKVFNDDKNVGNIEIFVKLNQPAQVYVLWCKRIPAPSWLKEEFEDTGDVIGVDEGRHVFHDGTVHERSGPGVGPGESVDSIHSVWRRKEIARGTVRLGPTEAPGWDFNVYGIVAVPAKRTL